MNLINKKSSQLMKKAGLITATNQNCKISEQYRTIRTNFLSLPDCIRVKSLVITSPNRYEGKSTTAANFSTTLTQQGKKVLLIDANLRYPILHSIFKVDNSIGLSDLLAGRVLFEDSIRKSGISGLDLITTGPIPFNPSELLGSAAMKSLIEIVNDLYDVIIFDTPAVLDVSDAKIIANQCNGQILVIRWGKTKSEEAIEAKKILESAVSRFLGVIINEKE